MSTRDLQRELDADNGVYPESWKPKPGDSITGVVVRYAKGPTPYGERWIVVLRVAPTETHGEYLAGVWLSHKVLVDLFKRMRPKKGEAVAIKRLEDNADPHYARYVVKVDRPEESPAWDALGENGETTAAGQ